MNILFICHRIPYPPNKGDKIRSYHILKHLTKHHRVFLFCLIDQPADLQHLDTLRALTRELHFQVISPVKKPLSLSAHFSGTPATVPYFYSSSLQQRVDEVIAATEIDGVFCYSSPSAEYIFRSRQQGKLRTTRKVMDFIDMDSLKWLQYAKDAPFFLRWLYIQEGEFLLNYEKRIAEEFDHLLFVSEQETRLFQRQVEAEHALAIPNGVDLEFFHPDHHSSPTLQGPTLVFTGAMDYRPNIQGILWFTSTVLPLIREQIPEVTLYIVGSNPTREVRNLAHLRDVHVTGFVPDVRDYVGRAEVCIAPLQIARGVQNKVLEAMAMAKPVVCTSKALEGITAEAGRDLLTADQPDHFAAAVVRLLTDRRLRRSMGNQAREAVLAHYSWERSLALLDDLLAAPERLAPAAGGDRLAASEQSENILSSEPFQSTG